MSLEKFVGIAGLGAFAGVNGYSSLHQLMDVMNAQAIVLQQQLSQVPALTPELYRSATEAADKVARGDFVLGFMSAAAAGLSLGMCVYYACRKEKE